MNQRWTLCIENFARIDNARIEIAPLMLFVGDNNSGKSYVMSLLWGMLSVGDILFEEDDPKGNAYKKCDDWLINVIKRSKVTLKEPNKRIEIDKDGQSLLLNWFNELLGIQKGALLRTIFNHPVNAGNIRIEEYKRTKPFYLEFIYRPADRFIPVFSIYESKCSISVPEENMEWSEELRRDYLWNIVWLLLFEGLTSSIPDHDLLGSESPLYLPASRTGFMLTYKQLIGRAFRRNYTLRETTYPVQETGRYQLVVYNFLEKLLKMDLEEDGVYHEVAAFLETNILNGRITKDSSPIPNYQYIPSFSNEALPLYLTSSLVAELSPLILFLKSNYEFPLLIVEEPEAHLHLELQRLLTRALARLTNLGLPVWITTHSDTIFQQVNNLIAIQHLINQGKKPLDPSDFNYEQEDLLDRQSVRVYQFTIQPNGKTKIESLTSREEGFVVPTFNESIWNLSQEVLKIQELMTQDAED